MTEWHFRTRGRELYATGPAWTTDEQYIAMFKEALPEQNRIIALGGELLARPPEGARAEIRRLAREYGFEFVCGRKPTDGIQRRWMIFRKKREVARG